jgi:uncharacterized protein YjlB
VSDAPTQAGLISCGLLVYKSAVRLPETLDPAAVFEELFESNGWGDSWRDGIYDRVHYHSRIQEVLGISRVAADAWGLAVFRHLRRVHDIG